MKLNTKLLKFLFIVLFLSFLPLQVVHGANAGLVHSYLAEEPTIDGILEADLWQTSRKLDVDLYSYSDQTDILTISIMSIYNEENGSITFAFEFPDSTGDNDDLVLVFKTNTTANFVEYYSHLIIPRWAFSPNNDIKVYSSSSSDGTDMKSQGYGLDLLTDTGYGGTDDVLAAAHQHGGNKYTIEFMTKLDSGDVNGADISLSRDDTIDFFVMYYQDSQSKFYTQIRMDDNEWDHCVLEIGKPGLLGLGSLFIAASLISTFVIYSIIARKKQKSMNK